MSFLLFALCCRWPHSHLQKWKCLFWTGVSSPFIFYSVYLKIESRFIFFLCLVYSSRSNVHYFTNLETNASSSKSKTNSSLLLSGSVGCHTVTSSHSQWESYRSGFCAPVYKPFALPVEDGILWMYLYQLLNFELSIQFPHFRVRLTLCCVTINYCTLGNLFNWLTLEQ